MILSCRSTNCNLIFKWVASTKCQGIGVTPLVNAHKGDSADSRSEMLRCLQGLVAVSLRWNTEVTLSKGFHYTARHSSYVLYYNDVIMSAMGSEITGRLFRRKSKKTSKLRVIGLCEGNSPVTGEFPAQRASNAENISIWWRHHGMADYVLIAPDALVPNRHQAISADLAVLYIYVTWITQQTCRLLKPLIHWGRRKMAATVQAAFPKTHFRGWKCLNCD